MIPLERLSPVRETGPPTTVSSWKQQGSGTKARAVPCARGKAPLAARRRGEVDEDLHRKVADLHDDLRQFVVASGEQFAATTARRDVLEHRQSRELGEPRGSGSFLFGVGGLGTEADADSKWRDDGVRRHFVLHLSQYAWLWGKEKSVATKLREQLKCTVALSDKAARMLISLANTDVAAFQPDEQTPFLVNSDYSTPRCLPLQFGALETALFLVLEKYHTTVDTRPGRERVESSCGRSVK